MPNKTFSMIKWTVDLVAELYSSYNLSSLELCDTEQSRHHLIKKLCYLFKY